MSKKSGWTTDTLKEHFDSVVGTLSTERERSMKEKFDSLDAQLQRRFDAAQVALNKAENALNKQLEGIVAQYNTLRDAQGGYLTRTEINAMMGELRTVIERNRDELSTMLTRSQYGTEHTALERRVAVAEIGATGLLPRAEFNAYLDRQDDLRSENRRALLAAAIAILVAIISVVIAFVR